ncbi:hypothetical protein LNP74_13920 [Klebsiella pneumoniae subsp. pneumoniae]|nr:hypothetical protein [Klebsiella pneumoniae subsp. pneumoniae]
MRHGEWQEASIAFRAPRFKQRPDAFDYAWLADALDRLHQPEEAAAGAPRWTAADAAE